MQHSERDDGGKPDGTGNLHPQRRARAIVTARTNGRAGLLVIHHSRLRHHRGAQQHLTGLVGDLISERAKAGTIRDDVPPAELANFCLHALSAAAPLKSTAAVRRLCNVVLAGIAPKL